MSRTLVNTREIEVIPRYAKKNKSPHGLPRHNSRLLFCTITCGAEWGKTGHWNWHDTTVGLRLTEVIILNV